MLFVHFWVSKETIEEHGLCGVPLAQSPEGIGIEGNPVSVFLLSDSFSLIHQERREDIPIRLELFLEPAIHTPDRIETHMQFPCDARHCLPCNEASRNLDSSPQHNDFTLCQEISHKYATICSRS